MDEIEIKKLLEIKERISTFRKNKELEIEKLKQEIDILFQMHSDITKLISKSSFTTAAEIMISDLDVEAIAKEKTPTSENVRYSQQIKSTDNKYILANLRFENNTVYIRFPNPSLTQITQESYINQFVKPTLVILKQIETSLTPSVIKGQYGDKEYLDQIVLKNVSKFESFEFLVEKVEDFLGKLDFTNK